jgi:hypothetical protein
MAESVRVAVLMLSLGLGLVAGAARGEGWAEALAEVDPVVAVELEFLLSGHPNLEEMIEVYRRAAWVADMALADLAVAEDAHFAALGGDDAADVQALADGVVAAQDLYGAALAAEQDALLQMTGGMMLSGEARLALRGILMP